MLSSSLSSIAHTLGSRSLGPDSTVVLLWPRRRCPLLDEGVVVLDSPGVDVSADSDGWIDRACLDSDLFVWVVAGEATAMMREKAFFAAAAERAARPDVLGVINRWDCTWEEEEYRIHAAHAQHLQRTSQFLLEHLGLASKEEAEKRVFFTSAKEILQRSSSGGAAANCNSVQARHMEDRFKEWERWAAGFSLS